LFGNDVISAGGSTGVTWWGVAIYINGIPAGETPYTFNSNTSYDLTTAIPNTTNPVIPTPTGDSTYLRLDGGNNPMTGQVAAKNGTAASPGLAFASDLTTGFARQAASVIGGAIAGTFRWLLSATGELLGSGGAYGWSSNADPSLAAGDSFLARISAKILGIGSTNGGTDGELRLAKVNKVTITQPATGSTLTIADGKTLTANSSTTIAGTDGKTLTVNNSLTLAGTDGTTQTFQASDTIVGRATTDTLSNKTLQGASSTNSVTLLNEQGPAGAITGTGADAVVYTFTIPANVIAAGKGIRVRYWANHNSGATAQTHKLIFGASNYVSNSDTGTGQVYLEAVIFNNAGVTNAQHGSSVLDVPGLTFNTGTFTGL
jgi:hypothetical protein